MITDPQVRDWCERAERGDREAASALLREFHRPIYAYLRRLTGREADAADLTQVTFLKVWQSLGRFRGASSVSTWMHRIAYCSYVDWLRQSRPPDEQSEAWWRHLPAEAPPPSDALADREAVQRVCAAVARLAEDERQPVHLHYLQGLTLAETAEVLDLPVSTLKYRLRAGLDSLRRSLSDDRPVALLKLSPEILP
jgi:RNA polymerase sigma-70 factor (ECF subfamily)